MSFLNQVNLIGNLGAAPEVLKNTDGGSFVRLSVATSNKYVNAKGEIVVNTQWHTVYLSNGVGKYAASYLTTGAKVYVSGELRKQEWTDKTGQKRFSIAVYGKECKLLSKKPLLTEDDSQPVESVSVAEKELEKMHQAVEA